MPESVPAPVARFPVNHISPEVLRSLKEHNQRNCTYAYVVENAQFYLGPINQLLPCVIVGKTTYWRDAEGGGREQVTAYHFRQARMTERTDGRGLIEKVDMLDAAEDALLKIAYVKIDDSPDPEPAPQPTPPAADSVVGRMNQNLARITGSLESLSEGLEGKGELLEEDELEELQGASEELREALELYWKVAGLMGLTSGV